MALDKYSDEELAAIANEGDLSQYSDAELEAIAGGAPQAQPRADGRMPWDATGISFGNKSGSRKDVMGVATPRQRQEVTRIKQNVKRKAEPVARGAGRAALQLGGAVLGGAMGAASPVPGGTVAGGALGYGMGQQLADAYYNDRPADQSLLSEFALPNDGTQSIPRQIGQEVLQGAGDVGEGLLYELAIPGAVALGRGAKAVGNAVVHPRQTVEKIGGALDRFAERKAGDKLIASKTTSPAAAAQIEKNAAANAELEKAIPGFNLNTAQKSGDPNLLGMARAASQRGGDGAVLYNETTMQQGAALDNYVGQKIRGNGNIDDLLHSLKTKQNELSGTSKNAANVVESDMGNLSAGMKPEDAGGVLSEKITANRSAARQKSKQLYDAVPEDTQLDSAPLFDGIKREFAENDPDFGRVMSDLNSVMRRAENGMTPEPSPILGADGLPYNQPFLNAGVPEPITIGQIKNFRSQVSNKYREAIAAKDHDRARRYSKLMDAIGETEDLALQTGNGDGIKALRAARDYYRNEYIPTFRQGATGKIAEKKKTGEAKVFDSSVPGEYFKKGKGAVESAKDFKRTFGDDGGAREALLDFARHSLLNHLEKSRVGSVGGALKSEAVRRWKLEYKTALEAHGLQGEFGSIEKSIMQAEKARGTLDDFNKSALGKVLDGVNPEKVIPSVMERNDSQKLMWQLVNIAKQDKTGAAMKGLKAAVGDYFKGVTTNVTRDLANRELKSLAKVSNFVKKHEKLLKTVYTPQEMTAFNNVQKALVAISKQGNPTPGFNNSASAEILHRMIAAPGIQTGNRIIRGVLNTVFTQYSNKVDAMVTRALYDPAYAERITNLAGNIRVKLQNNRGVTADEIANVIKSYLPKTGNDPLGIR